MVERILMKRNKYGIIGHSQIELVDALKCNPKLVIDNIYCTNPESYNKSIDDLYLEFKKLQDWNEINDTVPIDAYHAKNQKNWKMPDEYKSFDIESWLCNQCTTHEQLDRVEEELISYNKFNLVSLLKYLKYLVDTIKSNNVILGVGRGSSCASYCLYLIGVHRVDSIKYKLNINEFLRKEPMIINIDEGEQDGKDYINS